MHYAIWARGKIYVSKRHEAIDKTCEASDKRHVRGKRARGKIQQARHVGANDESTNTEFAARKRKQETRRNRTTQLSKGTRSKRLGTRSCGIKPIFTLLDTADKTKQNLQSSESTWLGVGRSGVHMLVTWGLRLPLTSYTTLDSQQLVVRPCWPAPQQTIKHRPHTRSTRT